MNTFVAYVWEPKKSNEWTRARSGDYIEFIRTCGRKGGTPERPLKNNEQCPLLVTKHEVANMLGVSIRTIQNRSRDGQMPKPIRLGQLSRFRKQEIIDWINAGCPHKDDWTWAPKQ